MDKTAVVLMTVLAILIIGLYPYLGIVSKPVIITLTTTSITTATRTLTNIVTETVTTTLYTAINIAQYRQDPELNITVVPKMFGGFINGLRIYLTNNGNTTKYGVKLLIVSRDLLGFYSSSIETIDQIEPGITLRYDIDLPAGISWYQVFLVY